MSIFMSDLAKFNAPCTHKAHFHPKVKHTLVFNFSGNIRLVLIEK